MHLLMFENYCKTIGKIAKFPKMQRYTQPRCKDTCNQDAKIHASLIQLPNHQTCSKNHHLWYLKRLILCRNARHSDIPNAAMPNILTFPMPDPLAFKIPIVEQCRTPWHSQCRNAGHSVIPNAAMPDTLTYRQITTPPKHFNTPDPKNCSLPALKH